MARALAGAWAVLAVAHLGLPSAATAQAGAAPRADEPRPAVAAGADALERFCGLALQRIEEEGLWFDLGAHRAPLTRWDREGRLVSPVLAEPPAAQERPTRADLHPRSDWTPYAGPFGHDEAAHLLHRAQIGPRWAEFDSAATHGLDAALSTLLLPHSPPAPPGDWATEPYPDVSGWTPEMIDSLLTLYRERARLLQLWWAEVMISQETSLIESMVLFWHDHFATRISKVTLPQSMYVQNALIRSHALGNFRELTRELAHDPAMLLWLDGQYNRVGSINENFSRELLELFTLGIDQYSQGDVVAAARAFTGWVTLDGVTSMFVPDWHDDGHKEFLGQGGNWDGDDIVDIIFQQDETARFLCRKLYRWFIDEFPDEILIEDLAQTMRDNDYEILPVIERMLRSEHFFDVEYRGAILTDGIDRANGLMRTLLIGDADLSHFDNPPAVWLLYSMGVTGHLLFEPPNVAGWPGYRTWINSYTLPWRKTLDVGLVDGIVLGFEMEMQADALALVAEFRDPDDADQLIDDTALLFFGMPPTDSVRQRMMDELLGGMQPEEWHLGLPDAESRVQALLRLVMRLPDFQLK